MPARTASSMSWLMYAKRSTSRTMRPSSVSGASRPGVLEDAVAHLPRQVEPATVALEPLDDAQRVLVVAEAAEAALAQQLVERLLAGVAERRVADVVAERDRLGQILVQAQRPRDPARDPGRLERVREPRAEVVALGIDEDLRLVAQTPERLRVDDAVAVALERRPQAAFLLWAPRARASRTSARQAARATAPRAREPPRRSRRRPVRRSPASSAQSSPARRGAGSGPNVDTCADAPAPPSGRPARRRLRLGQPQSSAARSAPSSAYSRRRRRRCASPRARSSSALLENVRGRDVYVVQSTIYPANDNVVELLFWLDACRRASAASVTAVVPYFSYGKGDKKDEPRVSIRARVLADAIEVAGADRVVTMDLHAPQIQGFFRVAGGRPVRDADPRRGDPALGSERPGRRLPRLGLREDGAPLRASARRRLRARRQDALRPRRGRRDVRPARRRRRAGRRSRRRLRGVAAGRSSRRPSSSSNEVRAP